MYGPKRHLALCAVVVYQMIIAAASPGIVKAEDPSLALVNDDEVRLRSTPSLKGRYVGILYKNMLVTVLEKGKEATKVGEVSHPWYRVQRGKVDGWCYGQYLTLDFDRKKQYDTYAGSGDMTWFYDRYGAGTAYEYAQITVQSFSIADYRNLIAATATDAAACAMLSVTIFPYLEDNPTDLKYQYLKEKLNSREFWRTVRSDCFWYSGNRYYIWSFLPTALQNDKKFALEVLGRKNDYGRIYPYFSPDLKKDQDVILAAVKNNYYGLDEVFRKNPDKSLLDNRAFMQKAIAVNPGTYVFFSERLKKMTDKKEALTLLGFKDGEFRAADIYKELPEDLQKDQEIVLSAVKNSPDILYNSPIGDLMDNEDFVRRAISRNPMAFNYASTRLKDNLEFVRSVSGNSQSEVLRYASPRVQKELGFTPEPIDEGGE